MPVEKETWSSVVIGLVKELLPVGAKYIGTALNQRRPSRRRPQRKPSAGGNPIVAVANLTKSEDLKWNNQLLCTLDQVPGITVERLGTSFTEQEGSAVARTAGAELGAAVVVWGYVSQSDLAADVTIHLEVLEPAGIQPSGGRLTRRIKGSIQAVKAFELQDMVAEAARILTLLTMGCADYAADRYDRAISAFEDLLGEPGLSESEYTPVRMLLGNANFRSGRFREALVAYEQALESPCCRRIAFMNKGLALHKLGRPREAFAALDSAASEPVRTLDQALVSHPEAVVYYQRGSCHLLEGNLRSAIEDLTRACTLVPSDYFALLNRGVARWHKGDLREAVADYTACIGLDPKRSAAYRNRGRVFRKLDQRVRALADFNMAIRLGEIEARLDRAELALDAGLTATARRDVQRTLQHEPYNGRAYYVRALCWANSQPERALGDLEEAERLDPLLRPKIEQLRAKLCECRGDELNARRAKSRFAKDASTSGRRTDMAAALRILPPNPLYRQQWRITP